MVATPNKSRIKCVDSAVSNFADDSNNQSALASPSPLLSPQRGQTDQYEITLAGHLRHQQQPTYISSPMIQTKLRIKARGSQSIPASNAVTLFNNQTYSSRRKLAKKVIVKNAPQYNLEDQVAGLLRQIKNKKQAIKLK